MVPGYLKLFETGELQKRIDLFKKFYSDCTLCPHQCRVNRNESKKGICCSGSKLIVASYNSHFGEEPPISGIYGSGTIFFGRCSGRCIFCQNYPISQIGTGKEVSDNRLAEMMLELQERKCHNINLVTPTHFLPSILSAILTAAEKGLKIPIVYNTSGYERYEVIRLLEGIIDVYLPDSKYADNEIAKNVSGFQNYVENNRSSLIEMYKQSGNLIVNKGIAVKGLIIRHLILPENYSGTCDVLKFISEKLSKDVHISLMDQYFPSYKALKHSVLSRRITLTEYNNAIESFYEKGLHNGWIQEHLD
jgi:putative pyruvate formate lyase activating enzyme